MDYRSSVSNVNGIPASDQGLPHKTQKGSAADGKRQVGSTGTDSVTSGMSVSSVIPVTVKQTDHNALVGSNAGDHRINHGDTAKASLFAAADNGGPRSSVGQFKGAKSETQPPFISTANAEETGD